MDDDLTVAVGEAQPVVQERGVLEVLGVELSPHPGGVRAHTVVRDPRTGCVYDIPGGLVRKTTCTCRDRFVGGGEVVAVVDANCPHHGIMPKPTPSEEPAA